jgi:hypothetical protein
MNLEALSFEAQQLPLVEEEALHPEKHLTSPVNERYILETLKLCGCTFIKCFLYFGKG